MDQPTPQQNIPELEPHRSFFARHILAEVLGLVLAGAVLAGGYFYNASMHVPETMTPIHREKDVAVDLKTYTNSNYNFSLDLPQEIYSDNCKTSEPLEIVESENKITIGNKFVCESQDSDYLQGWTIYAANNITSEKDAQSVIDKLFGKGCEVYEWGTSFFIRSLNQTDENLLGDCKFGFGKVQAIYSADLKTIVFWELGQEYKFYNSDGTTNDEKILSSFKFTEKDQVVCIQVIANAKNPVTGEIREFPTPCDVPEGWEKVN